MKINTFVVIEGVVDYIFGKGLVNWDACSALLAAILALTRTVLTLLSISKYPRIPL